MIKSTTRYLLLGCIFLTSFVSTSSFAIDYISHRGICCGDNENTLPAIQNAWNAQADAVEVDLRLSKDGIVLLFHDEHIDDIKVSSLNFSDILEIDPNIPSLEQVFKQSKPKGNGYYLLDIKDNSAAYLQAIVKTIKDNNITESTIAFQSLHIEALATLKQALPNSNYIYLSKLKRKFPWLKAPSPHKLINKVKAHHINHVSIKGRRFVDANYINALKMQD